jgi:hypothetical protein
MSKKKWVFIFLSAILLAVVSAVVLLIPYYSKHYSEVTQAKYLSVVKPGLSVEGLEKAFGEPVDQRQGANGLIIFSYLAPAPTVQDLGQTNQFAGFEVSVKDGVVVSSYITTRTNYLQK